MLTCWALCISIILISYIYFMVRSETIFNAHQDSEVPRTHHYEPDHQDTFWAFLIPDDTNNTWQTLSTFYKYWTILILGDIYMILNDTYMILNYTYMIQNDTYMIQNDTLQIHDNTKWYYLVLNKTILKYTDIGITTVKTLRIYAHIDLS